MKEDLGTPGAAIGVAVLALLFVSLALAIYPGWAAIGVWMNRADAPAWVQAVGSVVAIAVAVALPYYQSGENKRQARQQARAFVATARGTLIQMKLAISEGNFVAMKNLHATIRIAIQLGDATRLELLEDTGLPHLVALRALVNQVEEHVARMLTSAGYSKDDVKLIEALEQDSAELALVIRERWPAKERPMHN